MLLAAVAGACMVGLMALTIVDIVGRSTHWLTIKGSIEISRITVLLLAFFGLGWCFANSGHIVVDLATHRAPKRFNRFLDLFWLLVAAAFLVVVAWLTFSAGLSAHDSGERSENLGWSPLVFYAASAFGGLTSAATCLALGLVGFWRGSANFGEGTSE